MDIIDPTVSQRDFSISMVPSLTLKDVIAIIQITNSLSWQQIIFLHKKLFDSQKSDKKDGMAYSLNSFKAINKASFIQAYVIAVIKNIKKVRKNILLKEVLSEAEKRWDSYNEKPISLRRKAYLGAIQGLFLDFDNSCQPYVQPQLILNTLKKYNISFLSYSSFSSTVEQPKFRVLIPYNHSIPADESIIHETIASYFLYMFGGEDYKFLRGSQIDQTSIEPLRHFYFPKNHPDNKSAWFDYHEGHFLSIEKVLINHRCALIKNIPIKPYRYTKKLVSKTK